MDIYHIWFNLKAGVRDIEFAQSVHSYLGHLKEHGALVGLRLLEVREHGNGANLVQHGGAHGDLQSGRNVLAQVGPAGW